MAQLDIIGKTEKIDFPKLGLIGIGAKVDTGADSSAIWASGIREQEDGLWFSLFAPGSQYHTGQVLHFPVGSYGHVHVVNSFGHREARYRLRLAVRVRGRLIKGTFTLADRNGKTHPVLLGRRLLQGKFLVDVRHGKAATKLSSSKHLKDVFHTHGGDKS